MSEIDRFATPAAFLLLLAAPTAFWLVRLARKRPAVRIATPGLLVELPVSWRVRTDWLPPLLRALAIALLAVALARPQHVAGETRSSTEGVAIQLLVDRSSSMREPLIEGGREVPKIEVVKDVVARFVTGDGERLDGREGDLIGLIAFAGFADTVCPLVRGHGTLADLAAGIETAQIEAEDGTAIGDALALAAARLKNAEREVARAAGDAARPDFTIKGKAIVLLTDGENTAGRIEPLAAAALARDWGIRVYAIGIRGPERSADFFTRRARAQAYRRADQALESIAETTGGRYFRADSAEALESVYAEIDALEQTEIEVTELTNVEELYPPFALAGLAALCLERLLACLVYRRLP
jgi:Ca-activated chloride channel family protein